MEENRQNIASEFNLQAQYFIEAGFISSKHASKNKSKNPTNFNNFEAVIVGTTHAFAAELLLKGIIYFYTGAYNRKHNINDLLKENCCNQLKRDLKNSFCIKNPISFTKDKMTLHLEKYLQTLDKNIKEDREEIERINKIVATYGFDSFELFLELHSNHFVKMRYSCEKYPPAVDMTFTSFLLEHLSTELKKLLRP
jgi:HEPN domain-containing protein